MNLMEWSKSSVDYARKSWIPQSKERAMGKTNSSRKSF